MTEAWSEFESETFSEIAAVAVPAREEQVAILLALLPFEVTERFHAVELGCGEGRLAQALLEAFPHASVLALDGSDEMRRLTRNRLRAFGDRAEVAAFDLFADDWFERITGADGVLSSLAIHHLDDDAKHELYQRLAARLSHRGGLFVADLVVAGAGAPTALWADQWDHATRQRADTGAGSPRPYERFLAERWNWYRFPDPLDKPARLSDQLAWLWSAGLERVDCFWLYAGHAVFGGYKPGASRDSRLDFQRALEVANRRPDARKST